VFFLVARHEHRLRRVVRVRRFGTEGRRQGNDAVSQRITRRPASPPPAPQPEEVIDEGHELRMTLFEHLNELRRRVFRAFLAVIAGTLVGIAIAAPVLEYLIRPYGRELSALGPTEPVVAYFRVSLMIGGIIAIPV